MSTIERLLSREEIRLDDDVPSTFDFDGGKSKIQNRLVLRRRSYIKYTASCKCTSSLINHELLVQLVFFKHLLELSKNKILNHQFPLILLYSFSHPRGRAIWSSDRPVWYLSGPIGHQIPLNIYSFLFFISAFDVGRSSSSSSSIFWNCMALSLLLLVRIARFLLIRIRLFHADTKVLERCKTKND